MKDLLCNSAYFGVLISIVCYELGVILKKKFKQPIFNPLFISICTVIIMLLLLNIDYESYYTGAKYLSYLMTPATVCLAIPLYEQLELLKNNFKAVIAGILSGVITSLSCVFALSFFFSLDHKEYVTLLPKSVTTAIGIGISEELGGIVTITVAVILITGILGNIIAETVFKLFRIGEPIAKGVAIGTSAHAIGTTKAMELGEIEGSMSSLSIAVTGLITIIAASIFANFI